MAVLPRPRLLHIFPGFALGGSQARLITLANAWGQAFEHALHASDGCYDAIKLFAADVHVQPIEDFPSLKQGSAIKRLWRIKQALIRLKPDLLLTYNWGTIEVAMANRLFTHLPHIHHEDGFGPDEAVVQNPKRVWLRRLALPGAHALAVPSRTLANIALKTWHFPSNFVHFIPNGVDVAAYEQRIDALHALAGLEKRPGELLVGCVGGLRPEKNPTRLVRVFAQAAPNIDARLVLIGAGPEQQGVVAQAQRLGIEKRIVLTGFQPNPARYLALLDIYAIPSDTEQFPISLVEAMAAHLPVVATHVGDIPEILSQENQPFTAAPQDETVLAQHLQRLLQDQALRTHLGEANHKRVQQAYPLTRTLSAYHQLYAQAMV
jgi:L-malate glycosyltransferase